MKISFITSGPGYTFSSIDLVSLDHPQAKMSQQAKPRPGQSQLFELSNASDHSNLASFEYCQDLMPFFHITQKPITVIFTMTYFLEITE